MQFNKFFFILILLIFTAFIFSNINTASAQSYNFATNSGLTQASESAGYSTSSSTPLTGYVSKIITALLSILGVVFLAFTLYGGIMWMTAAGNEDKVKKARELIIESIIGVIIVLAAYAISYFVLKATTASSLRTNATTINQLDTQ
ncbi:hypothetical protein JXE04_00785 [Patescibacteria group bacterium]|nr:hypothetical protein [Patescibacteria group bacterium]